MCRAQAAQADAAHAPQASAACHAAATLLSLSQRLNGATARAPTALLAPASLAALRKLLVAPPPRLPRLPRVEIIERGRNAVSAVVLAASACMLILQINFQVCGGACEAGQGCIR